MTSSSIWGASDAGPATVTMRVPVDTNSSSSPGQLTLAEIGTLLTGSSVAASGSVADGKILIGSTSGGNLNLATLTQGSGITITNGSGTITIAASGGAGTGTVTSVATGTGLTGGPVTTTGTVSLSSNALIRTITLGINGGGSTPSTGAQMSVTVPYAGTIVNWYLSGDQSGSCVIDVKRSGTSIVGGGNKPTLSSAASGNAAVSGWTSATVSAGDIIQFNLDSVTTLTSINLVLKVNLSS